MLHDIPVTSVVAGVLSALVTFALTRWYQERVRRSRPAALSTSEWRAFMLVEKLPLSPNTALYRFKLPYPDQSLGLPIGQHVAVRAVIDGKEVVRSYTPTSLADDLGHFDLVVKSYPTGTLSKWFGELEVGQEAQVRGPKGNFTYTANMCRSLGMIAGGTGITPMLQIIQAICRNPADTTNVRLIFANVAEADILLKSTLDLLAAQHPDKLSVRYVLNKPPPGWTGAEGFVTKELIMEHCPKPAADIKVLMCGPPPMIKAMQSICDEAGYEQARVISKVSDMVFKF